MRGKIMPIQEKLSRRRFTITVVSAAAGSVLNACASPYVRLLFSREKPIAINPQHVDFIGLEEAQRVMDLLWEETEEKYRKGISDFPWPRGIKELKETERIERYAKCLTEIWISRNRFLTPYDELSWRSLSTATLDFWRAEPVAKVCQLLEGFRDNDHDKIMSSLDSIHGIVADKTADLPFDLRYIPEKILNRTLTLIGVSKAEQLRNEMPNTVVTLFSLPPYSLLEASIQRPEFFPDPRKPE